MTHAFQPSTESPTPQRPAGALTTRRLMLAVALIAVLIPFPVEGLVCLMTVAGIWVPVVSIGWLVLSAVRLHPESTGTLLLCLMVAGFCLLLPYASRSEFLLALFMLELALANVLGPIYTIRRLYHGQPLASGHILWAWAGLSWTTGLFSYHPHFYIETLRLMGQITRLSLVLAVLLLLYGARPKQTGAGWAHYTGWVTMEFDILSWGLFAAGHG